MVTLRYALRFLRESRLRRRDAPLETDGGLGPDQTWRLICPDCELRRFHDPVDEHGHEVACRSCGSTAGLEERKAVSRNRDPNPDRKQPTLQQFTEEGSR